MFLGALTQTQGTTNTYWAIGAARTDNNNWGMNFFSTNEGVQTEVMRIHPSTRIGIGTTSPQYPLHINKDAVYLLHLQSNSTKSGLVMQSSNVTKKFGLHYSSDGDITNAVRFGRYALTGNLSGTGLEASPVVFDLDAPDATFVLAESGNVGIGTSSPSEKLSVNGTILTKKVKVTQTGWADFVFDPGYILRPLAEVESFIKTNGHLPDVPSAKEVEKDGQDVGEMNKVLLQKIEELTLYMIQLEKKNAAMEEKIKKLETGSRN